jgi:hypothetical protein
VKKLISIGVALALLTMMVMPALVAAQCDYEDVQPTTYAKIPFAILESGFTMLSQLLTVLGAVTPSLGIPTWLADVVEVIGPWTGGPLSWSVDMLGWGLGIVGTLLDALAVALGLPDWLAPTVQNLACAVFMPYNCNVTGVEFEPCDGYPFAAP